MAVCVFIQHRLGRTDGVSLEVDKWRSVLEDRGHSVYYIAGNDDVPGGLCIPELYPFHPTTERIIRNATRRLEDYRTPADLIAAIEEHAARIEPQIELFLDTFGVDLLLPNNLLSVGYNLPGMMALARIIAKRKLPTICHSHDFWWEDSGEVFPTCQEVVELYRHHAPPQHPWVYHVTINQIGRRELSQRRGLASTVVPNVFDFGKPRWQIDNYNADFRAAFDIGANDLVLLQATRILDRKAVELAIDLVATLQQTEYRRQLAGALYDGRRFGSDDRIVLVCSGYVEAIGLSDSYPSALQEHADELGVRIVWAGDRVGHSRGTASDGAKRYSLWDSYAHADMVTYPSIWEGWGNQFIEAVFAELPVVLFEYPVWRTDLAAVGFDVASFGSQIDRRDERNLVHVAPEQLHAAARRTIEFLKDGKRRDAAVTHNRAVAQHHFSFEALDAMIAPLIETALRPIQSRADA